MFRSLYLMYICLCPCVCQNGALSLNRPRLSFRLDDTGLPVEAYLYPIKDSNKLVEVRRPLLLRRLLCFVS